MRRRRASTSRSSPGSPGTRTAIGPNCARRSNGWPASSDVIGVKISVGLLALGLALRPAAALADPTDEAPKEGQLDPEYAAGKAAIAAKDWSAAIRSLSSAALRDTRNADIENDLGYAYRQSGQLQLAVTHYQR